MCILLCASSVVRVLCHAAATPQAWGGDIHLGRYDLLDKDDLQLGVRDRIKKATKIATGILLGKAFPADGPSSAGSTIADFGSAFGTTARVAAREYGCNVSMYR